MNIKKNLKLLDKELRSKLGEAGKSVYFPALTLNEPTNLFLHRAYVYKRDIKNPSINSEWHFKMTLGDNKVLAVDFSFGKLKNNPKRKLTNLDIAAHYIYKVANLLSANIITLNGIQDEDAESIGFSPFNEDTFSRSLLLSFFSLHYREGRYFLNVKENYSQERNEYMNNILHALPTLEENYTTFHYSNSVIEKNQISVPIYYNGYTGDLILKFFPNFEISFSSIDFKKELTSPQDVFKTLDEAMLFVKTKQRFLNLLNPPKRYFLEFCSKNKIVPFSQTIIHNALLEESDPEELEDSFQDFTNKITFHRYRHILYLHAVNSYIVTIDFNDKPQSFNNKEEAIMHFEKLCLEKEEDDLEMKKRQIFSNTQKMLN